MLVSFRDCFQDLLVVPTCPICRSEITTRQQEPQPCKDCSKKLGLLKFGLRGIKPVQFHAAGWYRGQLRREILRQRLRKDLSVLRAMTRPLGLNLPTKAVLVPIPSWKTEKRANPLPILICRSLGRRTQNLLRRSRSTVGQHHLSRQQRLLNMKSAFVMHPDHKDWICKGSPTWVVDDILTTGATAREALETLKGKGVDVRGLICLGRTP